MEKMDARKRYTQMVLKQSFLKLLKEKPVNRITVKEVCALAQLNRATFYAHYSDCFALMESIENELIDAFEKSLRYVNSFDVTALIEAIYDMVDQNQTACRILILGNTNATVLMRMIALAKADSIAYWRKELPGASETELEMKGLRHIRFHDLRHSCASLLLANDVPMKQIQEWLGHSDISTTANIYSHLDYKSTFNY